MTATATKQNNRVGIWVKVSPDLRNMFKASCAKRGRDMNQVLARFMKNYVTGKAKQAE